MGLALAALGARVVVTDIGWWIRYFAAEAADFGLACPPRSPCLPGSALMALAPARLHSALVMPRKQISSLLECNAEKVMGLLEDNLVANGFDPAKG